MAQASFSEEVQFKDFNNRIVGQMTIWPRKGTLIKLSHLEANERGEETVQLVESNVYEYELKCYDSSLVLRETSIVQPNRSHSNIGRLEPGNHTGLLVLVLENSIGVDIGRARLEVRSLKLNYHYDYRIMLDYITSKAVGLLMEIRAPTQIRIAPDARFGAETVHQKFAFLRSLLVSNIFWASTKKIISNPHTQWKVKSQEQKITKGFKPSGQVSKQIAKGSPRISAPNNHPVSNSMRVKGISSPSLPVKIFTNNTVETVDTAENRFIKFALASFEAFLQNMEITLKGSRSAADIRLLNEVSSIRLKFTNILSRRIFKDISRPTIIPFGSPVLQQRSGYREILQAWLKFNIAAHLSWDGGAQDVYGAGKRDVATLYEYWLFFQLLDISISKFGIETNWKSELIVWTGDRFDLKLKSGKEVSLYGSFSCGSRVLNVRFSYNRTFSRIGEDPQFNYPAAGSWTRKMRPDYTFSFWPRKFTIEEAERQELIVHVHFDAKYRVENLLDIFGSDSVEELETEKKAQRESSYAKRSDLLKMHAYRDAIRRTGGAYVLYPGDPGSPDQYWHGFHEILPGLGAFAIRPGVETLGIQKLSAFLDDVAHHICDRSTRYEQRTYHVFRIEEPNEDFRSYPLLPNNDSQNRKLRPIPPEENDWVLIRKYRGVDHSTQLSLDLGLTEE